MSTEMPAAFQEVLDETRTQQGFPGVQAGVWMPDGEWVGASGTSGAGLTTPITPEFHTRIGSITKTFTVTALLQLAEQGELSLDDTIGTYVPGMPNGDTATLANLATMTSGIPTYTESEAFTDSYFADPTQVWQPQQLVDVVKDQPAMFEPGAKFYYSNTNTVLLGMVIEQVTGKPVQDVFSEQIFEPLGLTQTSFPAASAALPEPYLSGITAQGQPDGQTADATNWNPSWAFTAGEMISNLEDLRIWSKALATGEGILGAEYAQKRLDSLNTTVEPNTAERSYGIGFGQVNGWIGHTGELPGYNTTVYYHPDLQTSIVVMVNSDIATDSGENPAPAVTTGLMQVIEGGGADAPSPSAS
jgi:D-alanyl-D-alanine carboxypeptidase